jgi:hypothetical protein
LLWKKVLHTNKFLVISKNGKKYFIDPPLQIAVRYSHDKKRDEANNENTIRLLKEYVKKLEEKKKKS